MEQPLVTLVALVLVALCSRGNSSDDFCPEGEKKCPNYNLIEKNEDFEERRYEASEWITTRIDNDDVMAANTRLKKTAQKILGNAWPVLLTHTEGGDKPQWSISWFVPEDTPKFEISDPLVTLETKPAATVYVKIFTGTPDHDSGLKNARILQDALNKAGIDFDSRSFTGAGYEPFVSIHPHNEIWIYAN